MKRSSRNSTSTTGASPGPCTALSQLGLLLGLWWRKMRRRPMRIGDPPRLNGAPTFLLINLLVLGNLLPTVFVNVRSDVRENLGFFAWHVLGLVAVAFGSGLSSDTQGFRATQRGDEFLQALPLSLFARLGAQIAASNFLLLVCLTIPLAAARVFQQSALRSTISVLLGFVVFIDLFVLGRVVFAWTRTLGHGGAQRYVGYIGGACTLAGSALCYVPMKIMVKPHAAWLATWWLGSGDRPFAVLAIVLGFAPLVYHAALSAERRGYDYVEAVSAAPRVSKAGAASVAALEFRMITRQGAWRQVVILSILLFGALLGASFIEPSASEETMRGIPLVLTALAVYVGALQIIGQAGSAVRRDVRARAFLSALPLSPYQVLQGKTGTLRLVLIPAIATLGFLLSTSLRLADYDQCYRIVLSMAALYIAVDGAVGVAFMSHGVGVVGSDGGEASSSFFTYLLLIPLLAVPLSGNHWGATMALFAVAAVAHEAQRGARQSVRWLDDPDAAVGRDTDVWRALLVASAFFAAQGFSSFLVAVLQLPKGFGFACVFFASALVLVLLTYREAGPYARPVFGPTALVWWLLGGAGGLLTAALSRRFLLLIAPEVQPSPNSGSALETAALVFAMVVVAPIAEEYFFRGWLQRSIAHDLPDPLKRWAFVVAAAAFAMAHIGSYGLPQLLVGLAAGALYAYGGGLGPAMLVHAVHNACSLWWFS